MCSPIYLLVFLFSFCQLHYQPLLSITNIFDFSVEGTKESETSTPLKHRSINHKSSVKKENSCGVIDNVATLYIDISDASYLVNRSFGVQLFFLITTLFMVTLICIFLLAITFTKASFISLENVVTFTVWAISNNIQMFCIVNYTSNLCAEVSKIRVCYNCNCYYTKLFVCSLNCNKYLKGGRKWQSLETSIEYNRIQLNNSSVQLLLLWLLTIIYL